MALIKLQRNKEALQDCELVIKLKPDFVKAGCMRFQLIKKAYFRKSFILKELKQYPEAITALEEVLKLEVSPQEEKDALRDMTLMAMLRYVETPRTTKCVLSTHYCSCWKCVFVGQRQRRRTWQRSDRRGPCATEN